MQNPSRHPRQRPFLAVAFTGLLVGALTAWHWFRTLPREPVYDGKTLSEWFFPMAWDFNWIPNDLYGHIHDELWDQLVRPSDSLPASSKVIAVDPGAAGPPHLDTNAIPWLVGWMGVQPTR